MSNADFMQTDEQQKALKILQDPFQESLQDEPQKEQPQETVEEEKVNEQQDQQNTAPVEAGDEKKEEPVEQEKNDAIDISKYFGGKYKTLDDAEKGYKNVLKMYQDLVNKVNRGDVSILGDDEISQAVSSLRQMPLVKFSAPDPQHYFTDGENFDIAGYMQDAMNDFILNMQQSITQGPLASLMFTMLQKAVDEHYSQQLNEAQAEMRAAEYERKLLQEYPILSKDKELAEMVETYINGLASTRKSKAEAEGAPYEPLSYDELSAIVGKLIGAAARNNTTTTQDIAPVEKQYASPIIQDNRVPTNPIEDMIEGMRQHKISKNILF